MADLLREIRANRLGFTFQVKLGRDPFYRTADGFLLMLLYRITRPIGTTVTRRRERPVIDLSRPVRTYIAPRGEPWGNDDPDGPLARLKAKLENLRPR